MADGSIIIDTLIDQSGADSGLNELSGRLNRVGSGFADVGSKLTKSITLPIAGAAIAGVKFAMDQEQSFAKVSTLLDSSKTDFGQYKTAIRTASSEMGISFDEYSESVYGSISAGVDAGNAIEFVGTAAKLAKGGFTDTATAVDVMTTAINAYGLEQSDATRISDMLINTQNLGKTTVDELASSMGAVIPTAQAQGVSLEQLSTGYAVLTKNGIATSEAGTYLKGMFGELGKSGTEVDKILREKTGKSFSELQESGMSTADALGVLQEHADKSGIKMSDMFGSMEAGSAAMVLAKGGGEEFNEILASMGDVAGATDDAFNKMEETATAKLMKAFNAMRNALAGLADTFLPAITSIIEWITKMIDKFANASDGTKKMILIIAGIAAAIGPVLLVIGSLIGMLAAWSAMMAGFAAAGTTLGAVIAGIAAPVAIVIAVLAGLIAIGVLVYKNWDTIKAYTISAWNAIIAFLQPAVDTIVSTLMDRFNLVKEWWAELQDNLLAAFTNIWNAIVTAATSFMGAITAIFQFALPFLKEIFSTAWNAILGVIDGAINIIMGLIGVFAALFTGNWSMLWANILTVLQGVWGIITSVISGAWGIITSVFSLAISAIVALVVAFMKDIWSRIVAEWEIIKAFFSTAWEGIKTIFSAAIDAIVLFFVGLGTSVMTVLQPIIELWSSIFTAVWEAIKLVFTAAMNWIKGIIATVMGSEIAQEFMLTFEHWKGIITTGWLYIKTLFTTAVMAVVTVVRTWLTTTLVTITAGFNAVKTFLTTVWNVIKTVIGIAVNAIKAQITTWINGVKAVISSVMNAIKAVFSAVWNAIKAVISSALNSMKSTTSSSMNSTKSTITSILNAIKSVFTSIWNVIKSVVTGAMNVIKSIISGVMNAIKTIFQVAWNAIKGLVVAALMAMRGDTEGALNRMKSIVTTSLSMIKNAFTTSFNAIKSVVKTAFTAIKNAAKSGIDNVKNTIKSGLNAAVNIVTNMGSKFKTAGGKIISMLADGITGAVGKVTGAIGSVVGKVRDFLPFSPAKTGPLDDIDHLNFHGPMVDSIKKGTKYVQGAMDTMLQMPEINHSLSVRGTAPSMQQVYSPSINVPQPNVIVTPTDVNLNKRKVGEIIWGDVDRNISRDAAIKSKF